MHRVMSIDIETYSSVDLLRSGVYRYTEAPDFAVLIIAYRWDDDPEVHQIDCTEKDANGNLRIQTSGPQKDAFMEYVHALRDPEIIKTAYNANFERACLAKWLGLPMPPEQWRCTMIKALTCGLPRSLADVGIAMGLPKEKLKDPVGKALIQYFSKPCKPTRTNGMRTRNLPEHDMEKWQLYLSYNKQDVVTEYEIQRRLSCYETIQSEQDLWSLDQHMNDHGVRIDVPMVKKIVAYNEKHREELLAEAQVITGLSNPNSLAQLKRWLESRGIEMASVTKDTIAEAMKGKLPRDVRRMFEIRQALGKTSVSKYSTMLEAVCEDGRLRGILQFYGANRSGRWAGRLVQTHNLAKNSLPDLALARELAAEGDFDTMETLFGETSFVFSELIRTAFIASPGCRLVVSDFSAIEARVVAWIAGEQWTLDAFNAGKDIYCETASMMYHVPVVKHGVNGELRAKGKVAVLACIAGGQKVLTDQGLVSIEQVAKDMKVWDGIEWVNHDGVVYRGKKEVIRYGGLEATEDHIVWAEIDGKYQQIHFGEAARSSAHLIQSGAGGKELRLVEDIVSGEKIHQGLEPMHSSDAVYRAREDLLDISRQYDARQDHGMPKMQPAEGSSTLVGQEAYGGKTEMREPERCKLQELRRARHSILFSKRDRRMSLYDQGVRHSRPGNGDRQDQQRWKLRGRESTLGNAARAMPQSKKIKKVYDILNAGPRNRFTVSDMLVHNCGYQGGVGAMHRMDRNGDIPEEELQSVVNQWRDANPHIVKLWRTCELAAKLAINEHRSVKINRGIVFSHINNNLFVKLPGGRKLCYWDTHLKTDPATGKESIVYMGTNQTTGQWGETETYGGKLVENIVQATARDCLAVAMTRVSKLGYKIVMHVHDEMIVDVPIEDVNALDTINGCMAALIDWAPGLPLKGDGYETPFYKKD